jgi:hypothetical protein
MKNLILGFFLVSCFTACNTPSNKPVSEGEKTTVAAKPQSMTAKISGKVSFPSEVLPEDLTVVIRNNGSGKLYTTRDWNRKTNNYLIEVEAPGVYEVFALSQQMSGYKAYYSEFVVCGMQAECKSHKPVILDVQPGMELNNIDPGDWYTGN